MFVSYSTTATPMLIKFSKDRLLPTIKPHKPLCASCLVNTKHRGHTALEVGAQTKKSLCPVGEVELWMIYTFNYETQTYCSSVTIINQ